MATAPGRFPLWQGIVSVRHLVHPLPSYSHHDRPLCLFSPFVLGATESTGHYHFSSIPNPQEGDVSESRWHELPPVPKPVRSWTAWKLNKSSRNSEGKASDGLGESGMDFGVKQLTALQWVTKCCPSLPNSLLHKLFRVRQVRQKKILPETQGQPSESAAMATRMKRVSVKTVLEEGTVLYLPRSVFQYEEDMLPGQNSKKTKHQPTASELALLQSLVLYKDAQILVINKPPGLPVQGGSQITKSLDSLMGTALSFNYSDGPRLVHRLDKETSGLMILARTQECAMLLHTLFREKTAKATETQKDSTSIRRVYWALVMGTPKQPQGRISVPLIKVVIDEGKVDKIAVAHDLSSENAQVSITDYKVLSPSYLGCTWLELHPVTGRKHQLRVHCAEVLGTPVFGDMKYGWRTQKEWLKKWSSHDSVTLACEGATEINEGNKSLAVNHMKLGTHSKVPLLHLHCREMVVPNVLEMLQMDSSRYRCADVNVGHLEFLAPLPPHMSASLNIWAMNNSTASSK